MGDVPEELELEVAVIVNVCCCSRERPTQPVVVLVRSVLNIESPFHINPIVSHRLLTLDHSIRKYHIFFARGYDTVHTIHQPHWIQICRTRTVILVLARHIINSCCSFSLWWWCCWLVNQNYQQHHSHSHLSNQL